MMQLFFNNKLPHGFKISIFSFDLEAIKGKLTSLKFCPATKFKGSVSNHSIEQLALPATARPLQYPIFWG